MRSMSSKKSLSTKPKQTYVGEEVVWAKVAGHGWWPAVVYSGERAQELGIHVPRTKYAVKFLGTDECATLTADNLIDYEQGRAKNEVASAKREKTGFHQAIIEAHELVYGFDEVSDEIRQRFPFVPLVKKEPSTNAKKSATGVTPKRAKQVAATPKADVATPVSVVPTTSTLTPIVNIMPVSGHSSRGRELKPKCVPMDFTPIPISSGAGGSGVAKRKSYQPGAPSPNTSAVLADVLTLSASQREEDDEQETKPLAKENKVLMSFQPMKDSPSIEKEDHEDTNDVKLPLLNISQRERRQSKPNKRFLPEPEEVTKQKKPKFEEPSISTDADLAFTATGKSTASPKIKLSFKKKSKPTEEPASEHTPQSSATMQGDLGQTAKKLTKLVNLENYKKSRAKKLQQLREQERRLREAREARLKAMRLTDRPVESSSASSTIDDSIPHVARESSTSASVNDTVDTERRTKTAQRQQSQRRLKLFRKRVEDKRNKKPTKAVRPTTDLHEPQQKQRVSGVKLKPLQRRTSAPAAERTLSPLPASRAHYTHALAETRCRWWLGKRARAAHVRNVAGGRASSPLLPFGTSLLDAAAALRQTSKSCMRIGDMMLKRAARPRDVRARCACTHTCFQKPSELDATFSRNESNTLAGTLDLLLDAFFSTLPPLLTLAAHVPPPMFDGSTRTRLISTPTLQRCWESVAGTFPQFN